MAPIRTQTQTTTTTTTTPNTFPLRISARSSKRTHKSKPLLSYSPQLPPPHPSINIPLLRNKLLLQCRSYIPSHLLHAALADGIYARAERWITPPSQSASRRGKKKRYYVLHTHDFSLQAVSSAWEARIVSGSQPIDAGNGVVLFVRERAEWEAFVRGYRMQGRRAGELMKGLERETERGWREGWRRRCGGVELGEKGMGMGMGRKEVNAGPMWVLVKSAVGRICRGEA